MKKTFFSIIFAMTFAIVLGSCGNTTGTTVSDSDSTVVDTMVVDSMTVDTVSVDSICVE